LIARHWRETLTLLDYLNHTADPDFQIELFANDAVFELPYLASIGPAGSLGRQRVIQVPG